MNEIISYKSLQSTPILKDVDGKKGIVTGYFASFDTKDMEGDVIRKGAFQKSITENGPQSSRPRIKHLFNHDPSQPLGVLTVLQEDKKGLYYESKIGSHSLGVEFLKMAESGLITEHSFGYKATKYTGTKGKGRDITEVKMYEGTSSSFIGINENTPLLSVKGLIDVDVIVGRQKAIEFFCKSADVSDETIQMLLLHSKQLAQYIIDIKSTQPDRTTEPQTWKQWFN